MKEGRSVWMLSIVVPGTIPYPLVIADDPKLLVDALEDLIEGKLQPLSVCDEIRSLRHFYKIPLQEFYCSCKRRDLASISFYLDNDDDDGPTLIVEEINLYRREEVK